jgi:hypothetical protein
MNKRERALVNLLSLVGIVGVFAFTRKRLSGANPGGLSRRQVPRLPPPSIPTEQPAGTYVTIPQGYRRATDREVTDGMRDAAVAHLSQPLGSLWGPFADEQGTEFLVAVETHSNAPKGASIVVRA